MARTNKCKICNDTNPAQWVGANHNLCRDCVDLKTPESQALAKQRADAESDRIMREMSDARRASILPLLALGIVTPRDLQ